MQNWWEQMKLRPGQRFTAVFRGQRYRFRAVDCHKIGTGLWCEELDGKLLTGHYGTSQLSEATRSEPTNK